MTVDRLLCGYYYASILVDETQCVSMLLVKAITSGNTSGIDLTMTNVLIESDGHKIDSPRRLKHTL